MRLILKILAAPFVAILTVAVWFFAFLLNLSAFVFGLTGTIAGLLGMAALITYSVQNGIILLVIAYLVSPMSLPMAAAWLLGRLQDANYALRAFIMG